MHFFLDSAAGSEGGFTQTLIMIAVALFFFYFILWRPEQKRRKKVEQQRSGMKQGDKVTAMGIVGVVDDIRETTVVLTMVDGAKVEFLKHAITEVHAPDAAPDEAKA